jgi:hypothetical protein
MTSKAQQVAERCSHAFSFDRYISWNGCARAVMALGFSEKQTEAILLSKWARWAADSSPHSYGYATAADLVNWMRKTYRGDKLRKEVETLTRETFPEYVEETAKRKGGIVVRVSGAVLEVRQSRDDVVVEFATSGPLHADLIAKAIADGAISFCTRVE